MKLYAVRECGRVGVVGWAGLPMDSEHARRAVVDWEAGLADLRASQKTAEEGVEMSE